MGTLMSFRSKRARYVGLGLLSLVAVSILWLRQPPLIDSQAQRLLEAELAFDGRTVFQSIHSHQIRRYGLTPEKVQNLYDRLVRPRLAGFRQADAIQTSANDDLSQGVAWVVLADEKGHSLEMTAAPYATDEGSSTSVTHILVKTWLAEYVVSKGLPVTAATVDYARAKGLSTDIPVLKELGIDKKTDDFGEGEVDWEAHRAHFEKRVRTIHAKELSALGVLYP